MVRGELKVREEKFGVVGRALSLFRVRLYNRCGLSPVSFRVINCLLIGSKGFETTLQ
jgi:hypothetical protein